MIVTFCKYFNNDSITEVSQPVPLPWWEWG